MVTLEMRQEVEGVNQALEDQVTRQVAEIMEAAETDAEQNRDAMRQDTGQVAATWKFSMPFAGVRYFSYD